MPLTAATAAAGFGQMLVQKSVTLHTARRFSFTLPAELASKVQARRGGSDFVACEWFAKLTCGSTAKIPDGPALTVSQGRDKLGIGKGFIHKLARLGVAEPQQLPEKLSGRLTFYAAPLVSSSTVQVVWAMDRPVSSGAQSAVEEEPTGEAEQSAEQPAEEPLATRFLAASCSQMRFRGNVASRILTALFDTATLKTWTEQGLTRKPMSLCAVDVSAFVQRPDGTAAPVAGQDHQLQVLGHVNGMALSLSKKLRDAIDALCGERQRRECEVHVTAPGKVKIVCKVNDMATNRGQRKRAREDADADDDLDDLDDGNGDGQDVNLGAAGGAGAGLNALFHAVEQVAQVEQVQQVQQQVLQVAQVAPAIARARATIRGVINGIRSAWPAGTQRPTAVSDVLARLSFALQHDEFLAENLHGIVAATAPMAYVARLATEAPLDERCLPSVPADIRQAFADDISVALDCLPMPYV